MKAILLIVLFICLGDSYAQTEETRPWYLSINATSLIPGKTDYFSYKKFHGLGANQVLSLEPEVQLTDRINLKLEFATGLNFIKEGTETNEVIRYTYTETSSCYLCYGHGATTYYRQPVARRNDLIFHVGLSPKFYFSSKEKRSVFFIQPTFRIGLMDKYAIDTYIKRTVETGVGPYPPPAPQPQKITELERRNEYRKNPYVFYRGEVTFGADLKISDRFSIIPQVGLATMSLNSGKEPDKIYTSTNGEDYVLTSTIENNTDVGFIGLKLNWEEDSYWKSRNRIQGILRISLRYKLFEN